ncbi:MAG: dihydrofolate reductase family protein [Acidimicrobiia bacterium]|nr:dihydrofolate reductase family protein [Acidimicrobiia bacterium]
MAFVDLGAMVRVPRDDPPMTMGRTMRRVHPEPAVDVDVDEAYGGVTRAPPASRPWVMVTMIATLDGAVTVDGRSSSLGNRNDSAVLMATRAAADVVLVGAGTVRAEGYGRPSKPGQRIGVVTATGAIDIDSSLFASGAGFLVVPEGASTPPEVPTLRIGDGRVDLGAAIGALASYLGEPVSVVQVEGGPNLNAQIVDADLVDEFNVTIAPMVVGGAAARLSGGTAVSLRALDLAHVLVDDEGYVFTRWTVRR